MGSQKVKIFIFGGSGFVGRNLIEKLVQDDYQIKVLVRTEAEREPLERMGVKTVMGDVLELDSFLNETEEDSVIFYLIHGLGQQKKKTDLWEIEERAVTNLIEAARAKKARQIIHLTGIYFREQKLSHHLLARKLTLEAIAGSGILHTIFRTSIIFGKKSASFEIIRNTLLKSPFIPLSSWRNSKAAPIHIKDIVEILNEAISNQNYFNQIIDVCGPKIFTYQSLLKETVRFMGRKIIFLKLPFNLFYLPSLIVSFFTDIPQREIYFLLESLKNDSYCPENQVEKLLGKPPRLIFDRDLFVSSE